MIENGCQTSQKQHFSSLNVTFFARNIQGFNVSLRLVLLPGWKQYFHHHVTLKLCIETQTNEILSGSAALKDTLVGTLQLFLESELLTLNEAVID